MNARSILITDSEKFATEVINAVEETLISLNDPKLLGLVGRNKVR